MVGLALLRGRVPCEPTPWGKGLRSTPIALALIAALALAVNAAGPFCEREDLFPPEKPHNHASCIVETPKGDLFVCWFHGSGERTADDVRIEAAQRSRKSQSWGPRSTLADTPGYPDCNPALWIDADKRLWLFYVTILDHHWEGALLKYQVSQPWTGTVRPPWERSEVLHITPGPEFAAKVAEELPRFERAAATQTWDETTRREVNDYLVAMRTQSTNLLATRLGWMPRAHPVEDKGRLILGLYHDGFSFSLMAITDDQGRHWHTSRPLIGGGNIQPSLARRRNGSWVAYMRDNGAPPKRLLMAESIDRGETWSEVMDSDIPNPGSGAEVITLRDGSWVFIGNDSETDRSRLSVWRSQDEGRTWPSRRVLESGVARADSFSYPSLIQARDGTLQASYSVHQSTGSTIRHAAFNVDWIQAAP